MKLIYWLFAIVFTLTLAGCNTVRGVGQDVEAAGDAIGDLADDAEDELDD